MAHLMDVLPLVASAETAPVTKAVAKLLKDGDAALKLLSGMTDDSKLSSGDADLEESVKELMQNRIEAIRKKAFAETLALPPSLLSEARLMKRNGKHELAKHMPLDALGNLAGRPHTTLAHLRRVTDGLCMVLMPFKALDARARKEAPYRIEQDISWFVDGAKKCEMDVYAIAPLRYYSVEQLVKDAEGPEACYSRAHSMTLDTISLQLPLFRTMTAALTGLDTRVKALEAASKTVSAQIDALAVRLTALEDKVARELKAAFEARALAEAKVQAAEAEALAQSTFLALDPLLFAIPKGTSLEDESPAIVGPAWGPDFSDALLMVSGLSVIADQRKNLKENWRGSY